MEEEVGDTVAQRRLLGRNLQRLSTENRAIMNVKDLFFFPKIQCVGYLQVNLGISVGVDSGSIDLAEQLKRLLDALVQVFDRLLLVLKGLQLDARQAADIGLHCLGGVLHLEGERELVFDQARLGVGVDVDVVGLGVLLSLRQDVVEGLETLNEGGDDNIIDGY